MALKSRIKELPFDGEILFNEKMDSIMNNIYKKRKTAKQMNTVINDELVLTKVEQPIHLPLSLPYKCLFCQQLTGETED